MLIEAFQRALSSKCNSKPRFLMVTDLACSSSSLPSAPSGRQQLPQRGCSLTVAPSNWNAPRPRCVFVPLVKEDGPPGGSDRALKEAVCKGSVNNDSRERGHLVDSSALAKSRATRPKYAPQMRRCGRFAECACLFLTQVATCPATVCAILGKFSPFVASGER
jgi:hypothetical protein